MKTSIYLIFTCLISIFAFWQALEMKNPILGLGIALGVWLLFIWNHSRRMKKDAARRLRERLFEDYMRSNINSRIRF